MNQDARESRWFLLVEAPLERGAPVDAPDVDSAGMLSAQDVNFDYPLQTAAWNGSLEIVEILLEAGADPSITSYYDRDLRGTPADAARRHGHMAVAKLLERRSLKR